MGIDSEAVEAVRAHCNSEGDKDFRHKSAIGIGLSTVHTINFLNRSNQKCTAYAVETDGRSGLEPCGTVGEMLRALSGPAPEWYRDKQLVTVLAATIIAILLTLTASGLAIAAFSMNKVYGKDVILGLLSLAGIVISFLAGKKL